MARTIAKMKARFESLTSRDEAYLALYWQISLKGNLSLAALKKRKRNPYWSESNKADDDGVVQRLSKANCIKVDRYGDIAFTDKGRELARAAYDKLKSRN